MPGINPDKRRTLVSRSILKDMQSYVKDGSCPATDRLWELYGDSYSLFFLLSPAGNAYDPTAA